MNSNGVSSLLKMHPSLLFLFTAILESQGHIKTSGFVLPIELSFPQFTYAYTVFG